MKRFWWLVVAALFFPVVSVRADVDGFRGMTWGLELTKAQKSKNMVLTTEEPEKGLTVYGIEGDQLTLGAAPLQTIQYFFWRDKLMMVMLLTSGEPNYLMLRAAVIEKFDTGSNRRQVGLETIFAGDLTNATLKYDPATGKGFLYLISKQVSAERQQAQAGQGQHKSRTGK
jgi:hypothetical protein